MSIVDAWMVVATQLQAVPLADGRIHWLGLDYAAVSDGLTMASLPMTPSDWAGLRLMERTATAALNGMRG